MSRVDPIQPPGEPAPQVLDGRIWVDGCWDFFHHGHAAAMMQARQLGDELYVGVHSDESILEHKGPTVMNLAERLAAVDACRWVTRSVSHAPYVTQLDWITHYGCRYVVHGDDVTSDSSGEDCYRFVKKAGRFKVVKRTPSISTTDLVGRMLLCTRTHFIKSLRRSLNGEQGHGDEAECKAKGRAMTDRIRQFATDASAKEPGTSVWFWEASSLQAKTGHNGVNDKDTFVELFRGPAPKPDQSVVYVDGGFDLFSSGHIEFLRLVVEQEKNTVAGDGWQQDYPPVYIVAGVHDDEVINYWKGVNYPIMNIYERGLCVLQCRYVSCVIFGAPLTPTRSYLSSWSWAAPQAVYHGPTSFMPLTYDPYSDAKELGIYKEVGRHAFPDVNAGTIVDRIMKSRKEYEERQRRKGEKADVEAAARLREQLEEEQRRKEAQVTQPT